MPVKKVEPEPVGPPPSAEELHDIIELHATCKRAYEAAHVDYFAARKQLVSALKRAGVDGFTL